MRGKLTVLQVVVLVVACDAASEPLTRPPAEAVIAAAVYGSAELLPGPIDLVSSADSADPGLVDRVAAGLGARVGRLDVECSGLDCTVDPPVRGYLEIVDFRVESGNTIVVTLTLARVNPRPGYARTDAYTLVLEGDEWRVAGVEKIAES